MQRARNVARNGEEEKREKTPGKWRERGVNVSRHNSPKSLLGNIFLRGPSTRTIFSGGHLVVMAIVNQD